MSASHNMDRQTFLAYLRQSGLVAPHELAAIALRHADKPRARAVARALVEEGALTRFQAERLLMGRTAGFLLGPYKILDQLGRGGMGRVYKAEHRTMGRLVALKVLANELLRTERAVQMFLHEVRAASKLAHPNIVIAYDADKAGDRYYLVLEYVNGPNLDQLVRKEGPLKVGLACDYVRQVCAGLQCAHARGMVHRDIKPANLLVQLSDQAGDSPGLVKISDFGLSRAPAADASPDTTAGSLLGRENTVMGTPDYLSPEQARSLQQTDSRSDLYSLGCTFYFLLTGQVPFPGGSAMDKMIRHATEMPAPLTKHRPDVPPQVAAAVSRLMAKRPQDRFQTAEELAAALQPFAVSCPMPWAPQRAADLGPEESGITPARDVVLEVEEELTALAGTLPPSLDETPRPESPSRMYRPRQESSSVQVALIIALSIIAGLLAVVGLMALVAR